MKKIYVLMALAFLTSASQAQQTCSSAVAILTGTNCNYSNYTSTSSDFWLKFVATSQNVNISLITTLFGTNATHIHNIKLLSGSCGLQSVIAEDELPFVSSANKLAIDLDASSLLIGNTYYIHLCRAATTGTCDKSTCTANSSSDPSPFQICVQNINVIIPLDFGLEPPAVGRGYVRNRGQLKDNLGNPRPEIKLYNTNTFPAVYIADNFISYAFVKSDTILATPDSMHRVDMTLVGGNTGTKVFKTEQTQGVTNYYLSHIPKGVTNTKSYYRSVTNDVYTKIDMQWYSNIVGEKFYFIVRPGGNPNDIVLKYDGATSVTALQSGGLKITTPLGNIVYEAPHAYQVNPGNNIVPMPWQCKFVQVTSNSVKFDTRNIPENMPLFIQVDKGHLFTSVPSSTLNLDWSTYVGGNNAGGNGDDFAFDVKTDNSGNVYMTGFTGSTTFPYTLGAIQPTLNGIQYDAFVAKFDVQAKFLWATYYGGDDEERSVSLLTSQDGFIYFAGYTKSSVFPQADNTGVNPYYQTSSYGEGDGFIVSLNPTGTLRWATLYGGYTQDFIHKITEDNAGNLIICGSVGYKQQQAPYNNIVAGLPACAPPSNNAGFPICSGVPQSYFRNVHSGGGPFNDGFDCFIAKFNSNRQLTWSTFFGGAEWDAAWDVIVNPSDNSFYITGYTKSNVTGNNATTSPCNAPTDNGFPMCDLGGGAFYQGTYPGSNTKAFVAKFSSSNQLLWSTFFGSAGATLGQRGCHLALNSTGDLYFVGRSGTGVGIPLPSPTCSTPTNGGFPLCNSGAGAYYRDNNNVDVSNDAFIVRFNSAGQIVWSTFYGGSGDENNSSWPEDGTIAIAISSNNKVFIVGNTIKVSGNGDINATQYPGFYYQPSNAGTGNTRDAFIACFDENNKVIWATNFGGGGTTYNAWDNGHGLTIDNANSKLYVTGATVSQSYPPACPIAPMPYCIGTINDAGLGWYDAFIARFSLNGVVGLKENSLEQNGFLLFPNPTSGNITISLNSEVNEKVEIKVYNILGQLQISEVVRKSGENFTHELNCRNLTSGIYLVNVCIGQKILSQKLIKD
ncbi:MAG: T9SS type A sorting domain-containing protein [Bacteroidetes bacterium]|nr:T9SS type A sorting domain-containing protein [Bacteroidota bacterium]